MQFLTRINEPTAIIDTEALHEPLTVAAYVISGKENALIDMGHRSSAEIVPKELAALGIGKEDLNYLLPTRVHLDHFGSCGALANLYPAASVLVKPRGGPHVSDRARLVAGAMDLFGEELVKRFGTPDPIDPKRVRAVSDDEEIALGNGLTLRAIWTPGHVPHHLCYFLRTAGHCLPGMRLEPNTRLFRFLFPQVRRRASTSRKRWRLLIVSGPSHPRDSAALTSGS